MNNKIQLWVAPTEGKVYDSLSINANPPAFDFTQGDEVDVELHLCKTVDGSLVEVDFPANASVRLAIGRRDALPTSGTFDVSYGAETATLDFNATSGQVETALNAMVGIDNAGGVTVTRISQVMFKIDFNEAGVLGTLTVDTEQLMPTAYGKVVQIRAGTVSTKGAYFLKIAQSPIVYQSSWDDIESVEPVEATLTTIGVGHKRVELTPVPTAGSWTMTTTPNVWRGWRLQPDWGTVNQVTPLAVWGQTTSLVIPAVAADSDFQYTATDADVTANKMFATSDYFQPTVKWVSDGIYDVIWNYSDWLPPDTAYYSSVDDYTVAPNGYGYPLTVNTAALKPRKGFTAKISFNTAEVEYFLAGETSGTANFEIEVSSLNSKHTILQTTCTIENDMIDGYAYEPISLDVASIPDAPSDGLFYGRKDGGWTPLTEIDGGTY